RLCMARPTSQSHTLSLHDALPISDSPSLPRSINKNPVAAILLLQQPRDPEFSASILRSPFSRLESRLLLRFTEAIFQRPHGKVRLLLINQEGRRQANGVFTCTEHQQAF